MNILMTGATGLIGSHLTPYLTERGHSVRPLLRSESHVVVRPSWCPERREVFLRTGKGVPQLDAVIHLAGENIAQRWSDKVKRRIRESRVNGTRLLCEALVKEKVRPKVLVCASATGIYGNRGDELLDEQSPSGTGFLTEVCGEWEAATEIANRAGIRVVNFRFGIVLSGRGGALKKMLPAFRVGLGGKLGDGQQYWSWIAIDDLVAVIELALATETLRGPVNVVSPQPLRNVEFTKTLAAALHRPAFFTVPKFGLKVLLGQMAEEALLSSFRVKPAKLEHLSFRFQFPELRGALEHLL